MSPDAVTTQSFLPRHVRRRALAGCLGLVVAAAGCSGSASEAQRDRREAGEPRPVRVVSAAEEHLARSIAVTGTLAAEEQVTLSLKVTGRLDQLLVDLGSPVRQGHVIARLAPTDFTLRVGQADAALRQARARLGLPPEGEEDGVDPEQTSIVREARAVLDEAKLTNDRAQTFVESGIGSRADLDRAVAAFRVAESRYQDALEEIRNRQALLLQRRSELELARQAVTDASLTAPFDGMVRERHATVGQYLAAGAPVATIVRMHPLRLRLAVPERVARGIRVTQEVRVTVTGDETVHGGRIARVSPAIDEASRTLMVEAEVPNPRGQLRPGSFANADIVLQPEDTAVVVPASALVTFAGVDKVLVVQDGKSVEKRVSIGQRAGERLEIVRGLAAGEAVIVDPGNLVAGERVRVAGTPATSAP
ncbi:MAG: efflux RND transporter periplasmic adaptor subunit [Luteitalea sp.]|nr:efflux RND transporter periplasmic adaptor subunit [Luteitalea sp.]